MKGYVLKMFQSVMTTETNGVSGMVSRVTQSGNVDMPLEDGLKESEVFVINMVGLVTQLKCVVVLVQGPMLVAPNVAVDTRMLNAEQT